MHKKRVKLPPDFLGTPTWPPFACLGTPIWPPLHHVKTLYTETNVLYELEVEQNCASLGCVYPAHGSASNMTV